MIENALFFFFFFFFSPTTMLRIQATRVQSSGKTWSVELVNSTCRLPFFNNELSWLSSVQHVPSITRNRHNLGRFNRQTLSFDMYNLLTPFLDFGDATGGTWLELVSLPLLLLMLLLRKQRWLIMSSSKLAETWIQIYMIITGKRNGFPRTIVGTQHFHTPCPSSICQIKSFKIGNVAINFFCKERHLRLHLKSDLHTTQQHDPVVIAKNSILLLNFTTIAVKQNRIFFE